MDESRKYHIVPVGDLVEHEVNEDCVCSPTPKFVEGGMLFLHHSLDGREAREQWLPDSVGPEDPPRG